VSRRAWALASTLTFVAYLLLHLPTSDLFDGFARRYGFVLYDRTTRAVFAAFGVAVWGWLWRAQGDCRLSIRRPLLVVTAVLGYALAMLAVNGIEAIHLPQYLLMVLMLVAAGLGRESAWLVATFLGALDETWQWQLLRRARPEYFDWNDVVLNACGAALGVLVARRLRWGGVGRLLPTSMAVKLLLVAAALSLLSGPVIAEPFYRFSPAGRWFHLASATEATALMAVLWWTVRDRGGDRSAPRAVPSPGEVAQTVPDRPEA
jgi:hypothetical protein